jgi:hypothetical protein
MPGSNPSPGGTSPGDSGNGPGSTSPSTPPADGAAPGPATPPAQTTYPEVGVFRITSLSPNRVALGGGNLVTVTGVALPSDPTVRIGSSATGQVVSSSTTTLVFRTPARLAGSYDVTVSAPDGRATVLSNALTYVDTAAGPPAPGATTPTTPPGTTPPGTTPPVTSPPGSTPPDEETGTEPAPGRAPAVVTGPGGERLVRSDRFRPLGGLWSLNCSASCAGAAI